MWTGVTPGDGPQEFHVVFLDNGRTRVLADPEARETLACIRCGACLNTCPVYRQTGGHAYGSMYGGPIGAILTPQLQGMEHSQSLPYASSLCGACYSVCPVKINIPEILIHLRAKAVDRGDVPFIERLALKGAALALTNSHTFALAQAFGRIGQIPWVKDGSMHNLPGMLGGWTAIRDLKPIPAQSFRQWWSEQDGDTQ
jgi:L-lactate dehydrogenase complex protein LldF